MLGDKMLAEFTRTPVIAAGQQAFDVVFADRGRENSMVVLINGSEQIGDQIRTTFFRHHPDATDYTFNRINYRAYQRKLAVDAIARLVVGQITTAQNAHNIIES